MLDSTLHGTAALLVYDDLESAQAVRFIPQRRTRRTSWGVVLQALSDLVGTGRPPAFAVRADRALVVVGRRGQRLRDGFARCRSIWSTSAAAGRHCGR